MYINLISIIYAEAEKKTNMKIINERITTSLKTTDFSYVLPEELIAQTPEKKRDNSRLLVLNKETGGREHHRFFDIIDFLRPEDILVVNSSKVIPARLLGVSEKTGSSMELLLLKMLPNGNWETLVRPGKRAKIGAKFLFGDVLDLKPKA